MQVTVQNENTVVVDVQQQETIVVEVDQGRAGRGIQNITYTEVSGQYFLIVTYTDGTTETLGPLVVTGGAAFLLGGATGSIPYQSAPNTTVFLPIGTQNQVVVAGATAPQYTSALTGLTVNNSAIGNTAPSTGAFTNLSASGTFALTGDQVQISEGGTGQTTANGAFNALAPSQTGNAGKYLKTDGTNSSWDQLDISTADITGTLPIANGGTGQTTANSALNALLPTQAAQSGKYLKTDGTNASWDQLDISTADITGVLPIANGGTGASTAAGARANLSAAILGTNNDITSLTGITGGISTPDFVQFDTTATEANAVGKVYWDAAQGTLDLGLLGGNVITRIGQTLVAYVTNAEAVTITKGQAVYLFGAQGNRASVKLASNLSDATSAKTFGVVAENIGPNQTGFIMCQGVLEGLNLGAYTAGDTLYLGATPGSLTATKPYAPNHLVYVGLVERANAGNGQLYVKVQNGYELDEIHDVQIINPQNGQTILYDASTSLWKNANLTAGTGISVTNGAASVTIGNTGVLSFSGGTTGLTPATFTTGAVTLGGTLAVASGGTGATTAGGALTNLGAASSAITISAGTGLSGGGDLTANRTLSIANTTVTAGAYGSASNTLTATVNAQGQLTALAATPIAIANTQISGLGTMSTQNASSVSITGGTITGITDLAVADGGTGASDASTARSNLGAAASATTISAGTGLSGGGDLSANRTLSIANTTVTAGAYGSASNTLTATVNAQGQLTALAATPIAIANTQVSGLGTMSTQNSNSVAITGGSITGITDLAIADGGTGASTASGARTNLGLGTSATLNAGVALGVATLDAGGTVPLSQLPASIQGGVNYQGSWDAATNTPTIVSSVGSKGYYYVVSVAGSTNINGISDWLPGDWIIFNGSIWQKIDNTDAVASVNGYTGVVVLNAADVGAAPTSRTITAGTGLTGGGDLSANRTISIANTTVAAGSYGSASSVGTFTVNGQGQLTAAASTPIAITNTQVSGLGTMSTQNANSVAITGGTIDGTTIGGTTRAAGSFTTLTLTNALSVANGGTGTTTSTGTGSVVLSSSPTLTTPNLGTPSAVTLTNATGLPLTTGVTGTLPIGNGGTGQTTANAAFNALAPSQTGNAGKYLTTDGTNTSWATNPLGTVTSVDVSGGTTGLTTSGGPITSSGTITLGGTLATTNGGTGLTSFTANRVFYASSTSAIGQSANLTFDGTTLTAANFTDSSLTSGRVTYAGAGGNLTDSANLTFDGTVLTASASAAASGNFKTTSTTAQVFNLTASNDVNTTIGLGVFGSAAGTFGTLSAGTPFLATSAATMVQNVQNASGAFVWGIGSTPAEQMRLTSTGLTTQRDATIYGVTIGRGAGAVSTNTAVGASALAANTTGVQNTSFGLRALRSNTTANNNTAIGAYALDVNTTGGENVALGLNSLSANTTGASNVALGNYALTANTTASNNTAVGYQAGYSNTTGTANNYFGALTGYAATTANGVTAFGHNALRVSTASNNTAFGYLTLYANTTGTENTAIGGGAFGVDGAALQNNTTGSFNTAVGHRSMAANIGGSQNTATGYKSLYSNTTGRGNVAMGSNALYANTTGEANTAVGGQIDGVINAPLVNNSTGSNNIAVGTGALGNNTTASNNTAVGYGAGFSNTTGGVTAFGQTALYTNTTGSSNTAVGQSAMSSNSTGSNNTAIGFTALQSNTTASNNTAVGYGAGYSNTTGNSITSLGYQAAYQNTTGSEFTAVGWRALVNNTTGNYNTAIGNQALISNTTASYNSALGYQALYGNTTGNLNTAVGFQSQYGHSTATQNTSVGMYALYSGTGSSNVAMGYLAMGDSGKDGSQNVAIGVQALQKSTTGSANTALGFNALYNNTTAANNTVVGYQAGYNNTTGGALVALGIQAGFSQTTPNYNTFVGAFTGYSVTTGAGNTFVGTLGSSGGAGCGYYMTTGSNNTIIGGFTGNQGGLDIRTANNYIVLSDGVGNLRGIYNNNGQYIVGTVSPIYSNADLVHFYGRVSGGNQFGLMVGGDAATYTCYGARFLTNNSGNVVGSITFTTTATAYNTSSDYRLKDNPQPLTGSGAFIDALQPKTWTWKTDGTKGVGFIAHEVQEVSPSSVTGEKDAVDENGNPEHQAMEYGSAEFIANIIAELQSLRARVAQLEAK